MTAKELMQRLADKGPDLGDPEGMRASVVALEGSDPQLITFISGRYGKDFATGFLCGLAIGYYVIQEGSKNDVVRREIF